MSETVENLILDLLEWVETKEHTYGETLDVWRTSCPRLTVWEDATDRRLVEMVDVNGTLLVRITRSGSALLHEKRERYAGTS
jgi:hypothetical protein